MLYDDKQQVVRSMIFCGASRAYFSFMVLLRVGAVLFGRRWQGLARAFTHLHTASSVWVELTIAYDEVRVVCSGFRDDDEASRGGVMAMTPACCLGKTLYGVVCVWFLMCAAERF